MKKNIKLFSIIFLLLLLVVAIASFSWFVNLDSVTIDSADNMSVQVGSSLEIGIRDENGEIKWSENGKLSLTKPLSVLDCSGDGRTFFVPSALDKTDTPTAMTPLEDFGGYVIDTVVSLKTGNKIDIYLGSKSYVKPMSTSATGESKSDFGNFSKDYISGCVRVAFFEVEYDENGNQKELTAPICVWAPNSKTQLSHNEETNVWSVAENGTPETEYIYYSATDATTAYTSEQFGEGKFIVAEGAELCTADTTVQNPQVNRAPKLLSFTPDGTEQEKHLLIRVWFEGTDREAGAVLDGGKVKYNFSLVGVVPKSAPTDLTALNALTLTATADNKYTFGNNLSGAFLYSTDGLVWSTLGDNAAFDEAQAQRGIYVCLKETAENAASTPRFIKLEDTENAA